MTVNSNIDIDNASPDVPGTATPGTREWKRTPVAHELAALIHSLDDALQTAFGFDLCYVVMARDGVIAASSSVHGYLPPIVASAPSVSGN